jgi:hypothetical protein
MIMCDIKNENKLLREITKLTTKIETKYPELYRNLDENPITLPESKDPNINKQALEDYLESLKLLIKHHN